MARVFFYIVLALVSSSCSDSQRDYHNQNSRLKSLVNDISAQMAGLGFPVNTDEISVELRSPEAMAAWFNEISDESRQENKNYVAYAPANGQEDESSRFAFYDPNSKTLVVQSGVLNELSNGYLAHELAHVYQDQKWGLKNIWSSYQDNPSRELFNITQYMIEGHAELARQAYEQKYATNPVAVSDLSVGLGKVFKSECMVCGAGQSGDDLPYTFGLRFLLHQYRKGGWALAENFLHTLPLSSEQILHPSKLKLDNPKNLELPRWVDKDMPAELILDGPMGEASLLTKLLSFGVPNFEAFRAASGWDGDRAQIYLTDKGEKALLWRVVFDRDIDAKQLENALKRRMPDQIMRTGRLVDWVMSDSPNMTSKLKAFLKQHPQKFEENSADEFSTELVELKATEDEALYFRPPKRMRIVIGPKND